MELEYSGHTRHSSPACPYCRPATAPNSPGCRRRAAETSSCRRRIRELYGKTRHSKEEHLHGYVILWHG